MIATVAPQQSVPFQSASLYVGDLHPDITEGILFELFNRVGPVASIRICRDTITKRSLGYGYVNFHNVQDAERALDTMNFNDIQSRPCRIMWSQRDPHLRKSGVGNIFVKNLPPSIDNKSLFDLFSVFGNILSCKVATDETGASKGYGYIHFETAEAANDAIQKFNSYSIDDNVIQVLPFLRRQERPSQTQWTNLYVKQFPVSWSVDRLRESFMPFGETLSVAVMRKPDGSSKGFGFVNFVDHESASAAIQGLHGTPALSSVQEDTDGDQPPLLLYVAPAQKIVERQRTRGLLGNMKREELLRQYQGRNLYVKNIDDSVSDEELLKLFSEHGTVANAKIMREANDASRGFGFVCFNSPDDAVKAITTLNGFRLKSKPLVVALHQPRNVRMAHLAATFGSRVRGFQQNPAAGGMQQMPYMYVQGAGQPGGGYPGAQQRGYYNDYNQQRGGPNAGGPRPMQQMRPPYYMPQFAGGVNQQMQQGQGNQMQQQYKPRMNGGQGQGGQMVMRGGPNQQGGMRGPGPRPMSPGGRVGYQQQPQTQQFPGRAGQGMKFTNQVRNQQPGGVPMDGSSGMQQAPVAVAPQVLSNMGEPLDHTVLVDVDPQTQKNMIGERLYPLVYQQEAARAGKITGMLLEMEIMELLNLLESPDALFNKVREAVAVLDQHERSVQDGSGHH